MNSHESKWFSVAVLSLPVTAASRRLEPGSLFVWMAAAALAGAACYRYFQQPTFWLDEAFIAVSLRTPSLHVIFGRLEYGQLFPRLYLGAIAIVREALGYQIWSLRLLPFLSFVAATLLWARLLVLRARWHAALGFLAGALLIGATSWLEQAIQLKQYTFDVVLALAPFLIDDSLFDEALIVGKRRARLIAFALPCALSYTYPFAMGARVAGWYLQRARGAGWRLNKTSVLVLAGAIVAALAGVWFADHRFNIYDRESYSAYWSDCILGECLKEHASEAPRLLAKFLWGWQGRQPFVLALLAPLQALGVYSVIRRLKRREPEEGTGGWGSRSLGSLILLIGVILASLLVKYPICSGRVVLFTQIHTQLMAIEGALLLLASLRQRRAAMVLAWLCVAVVAFHSVRAYARLASSEPAENLRPVLSMIKPEEADAVLVHSCSTAQVRSLPEPLPLRRVVFANVRTRPQQGEKTWVLWTHLGNADCVKELEQLRGWSRSWQIVHEGPGRGLALAEF
ncbi:MAG: hypothetical protein AABO41_07965 [Acidobacteriota bacterium]